MAMTPQEAIDTLKIATTEVEWNYPLDYAVAMEMAIKALKKEVPAEPITQEEENFIQGYLIFDKYFCCPICKYCFGLVEYVDKAGKKIKSECCPKCGQAIDWRRK